MIRALLLALLFATSAGALEQPISDARIGLASRIGFERPVTATHGDRTIVVWYSFDRGTQALVLDENGEPLAATATGVPIRGPQSVFWRDGGWTIFGGRELIRLDAEGRLLEGTPRALQLPSGDITPMMAAWTGETLLVALQRGYNETGRLLVATFDAELQPRETYDLGEEASPSLHFANDGETVLLAYHENRYRSPLRLVLFGRSGAIERQREVAGDWFARAIGTRGNGDGYVLVMHDDGTEGVRFSFLHIDHRLDFDVVNRFGAGSNLFGTSSTVAWDGAAYTFFYRSYFDKRIDVRGARIGANGAMLDDAPILAGVASASPWDESLTAAATNGRTLLLHVEHRSGDVRLLKMRVGNDVASLSGAADADLDRGAFEQIRPSAATNAKQSLVVWQERVTLGEPYWIAATRVDASGRILDPQSIFLGSGDSGGTIAVASDGVDFVVAWHESAGIRTVHVRADGTIAAKSFLPRVSDSPLAGGGINLFSNGSEYLLAWSETRRTGVDGYTLKLAADGSAADPSLPYELADGFSFIGASDGRDYLVAMHDRFFLVDGSDGRVVARLALPASGTAIAVWWDGTAYNVLQFHLAGCALTRVTAEGTITPSAATAAWPVAFPWWGNLQPQCDRSGCTVAVAAVENGKPLVREVRMTAHEGAPSIVVRRDAEVTPFLVPERPATLGTIQLVPLGLSGRTFVAFARPALEVPYAGIYRIFLVPMQPSRTRAVRH